MRGDRRMTAAVLIAVDVAIVLIAAYLLTVPVAAVVAVLQAFLFVRWWQRTNRG